MCREEGRAIADLAARDDKPLEGFGIFGLVKEVGVDDEGEWTYTLPESCSGKSEPHLSSYYSCSSGLADFQSNFFPFPLYKDEE